MTKTTLIDWAVLKDAATRLARFEKDMRRAQRKLWKLMLGAARPVGVVDAQRSPPGA